MNRQELIQSLSKKFELSNAKVDEMIKFILESITTSLSKNKPVAFVGFGTFSVKKRKARDGRNPKTGEKIKIPACKVVRFSVGKSLKYFVNKK
jgi:DNA-binding protein HU-beta